MSVLLKKQALRLTSSRVDRGLVLLKRDACGEWLAVVACVTIALVRCGGCSGRFRLLPSDVLARKTYGLSVIEYTCAQYVPGETGLRGIVNSLRGDGPKHSTLHAWTEGLGRHALGRDRVDRAFGDPVSAVVAETQKRCPSLKTALAVQAPLVDPRRYRSEPRRERLSALAQLLFLARSLDLKDQSGLPWCAWRRRAIGFSLSSPFQFPTGFSCTPIEHVVAKSCHSRHRKQDSGGEKCRPRARSPPGASS